MRVFFTFMLAIWATAAYGQNWRNREMGLSGQAGFLMIHTSKMHHLRTQHSFCGELFMEWQTTGEKDWHRLLKHPRLGTYLMGISLGNKELLGMGYAAGTYVKFPIWDPKGPFETGLRLGAGIGYLTESFHYQNNYKSIAIGSHINGSMHLGIEAGLRFKRFRTALGWRFWHFSNGAVVMPNLGVNYHMLNLLMAWQIDEQTEPMDILHTDILERKWLFEAMGFFGVREIYPILGPKYAGISLHGNAIWRTHRGHSLMLTLDMSYSQAYRGKVTAIEKAPASFADGIRTGIALGYSLYLGEFALFIQKGAYMLNKVNLDGIWFHRIGVKRTFHKRYTASLALKTHFFNADFIEVGMGYRFSKW